MDLFADGAYVRLRSRVRGTHLHADDDGVGVSLRPLASVASPLNAVWRVHLLVHQGTTFVLLHGAAYGRYIANSFLRSPHGHRGTRAIQLDHEGHNVGNLMWRVVEVDGDDDRRYVRLRRHGYNRNLRANGRHRNWLTGVTVDTNHGRLTTMMHWEVEAVPMRSVPLPFPLPAAVGTRQHDWPSILGITMCVRAGEDGRLTPLFTDLPRSHEPMDIVVLANWSQGENSAVFSDLV
ncbi:hypothetical protein BS78_10G056200 [Paspalum vaginatum]|nr:hypothetical protein BS78_10G056200 [Paspalum vaginatum]